MRRSRANEIDQYVLENRYMLILLMIALLSFLLFMRVAYLQIAQHGRFELLSLENHIDRVPLEPVRGLILDRNEEVLAHNVKVFNLEIRPDRVSSLDRDLEELSRLVEFTQEDMQALKTTLESRPSFERQTLKTNLTDEQVAVFSVNQHRFPGIELKVDLQRDYPYGELTSHIVGYVGRISPDDRELVNEQGEYDGISHIGKIGIESQYEKTLKGAPGHSQVEINAHGRIVRHLKQDLPNAGQNLHLSMDILLQKESMAALEGLEGAVVAIEPKTGEILALASAPTYDPNLFVNGISQTRYAQLNSSELKPLFNRSIYGQYAPGSTIKGFVSLVGLEHGFEHAREVYCPGWYSLPNSDRRYRCWRRTGHGLIDGYAAIERSCDVYFYDLAIRLGIDRLQEGMMRFGFGQKTGIDLQGERSGLMPGMEWKKRAHGQSWYPGDTVNSGIGQGYMLMTPVQLASVTATLANRGVAVTPHLLRMTENPVRQQSESPVVAEQKQIQPQQDEFYGQVIESMRRVVHGARGTARGISTDMRYEMAGKTGTAQVVGIPQGQEYDEANTPKKYRDHSLFVGFAPLDDPRIAIAVIVEHGGSGSKVAAPIARRLIDYYLMDRLGLFTPEAESPPDRSDLT
ncbi:MAG: penicillin-binding protein 2 [Gammaproteobacteria bacterium]|nr:penicillin-binding protein 2 [Gammaproteobacteria bacterium]